MKTVKQIDAEIKKLAEDLHNGLQKGSEKATRNKINALKLCSLYLETKPRPAFVQKMLETVSTEIDMINARSKEIEKIQNVSESVLKVRKREYVKAAGLFQERLQRKTLKYLLSLS